MVLIPLLGTALTAVAALLPGVWLTVRRPVKLLLGGFLLIAGSTLTGASWAAVVIHDGSSRPQVINAFGGMTMAVFLAASAVVFPVVACVGFREQAGLIGAVLAWGIKLGSLVAGGALAFLAFFAWFGAVSW
jgi:hypothetical protein